MRLYKVAVVFACRAIQITGSRQLIARRGKSIDLEKVGAKRRSEVMYYCTSTSRESWRGTLLWLSLLDTLDSVAVHKRVVHVVDRRTRGHCIVVEATVSSRKYIIHLFVVKHHSFSLSSNSLTNSMETHMLCLLFWEVKTPC